MSHSFVVNFKNEKQHILFAIPFNKTGEVIKILPSLDKLHNKKLKEEANERKQVKKLAY